MPPLLGQCCIWAIAVLIVGLPLLLLRDQPIAFLLIYSALVMLGGLLLESVGLLNHAHDMRTTDSEGAVSHYVQCTTLGKTYVLRNVLVGLNILFLSGVLLGVVPSVH